MKLFSILFLSFLFFSFNGFSQSDSIIIKKDKPAFWFGIVPQYCFGRAMTVAGPSVEFNFALVRKVDFKVNAYVVKDVVGGKNKMGRIANFSFMPGYRVFDKKYFLMHLHAGVSYGIASFKNEPSGLYDGTSYSPLGNKAHQAYVTDEYDYIGVPVMLTCGFTRKKIGFEISVFENFHKHPETGVSINFILGKFR